MKRAMLLLLTASVMFSCGSKGSDPTPANPMLGSWKVKSITRDDVDYTSLYTNTKFVFSNNSYSVSNRPINTPFLNSGTFTSASKNFSQSDGTTFNYVNVGDNEITFSFVFNGTGYVGGRVSEVTGNWKVDLVKE